LLLSESNLDGFSEAAAAAGAAATGSSSVHTYWHPHRRNAELVKNSLHDFAVRARQHLAKDGGGNLDINYAPIRAIQPGRRKPGVESIDADSGFYVL